MGKALDTLHIFPSSTLHMTFNICLDSSLNTSSLPLRIPTSNEVKAVNAQNLWSVVQCLLLYNDSLELDRSFGNRALVESDI